MEISIAKLEIRNFKGIRSLDVELGQSAAIYGSNATGKTTIEDAFMWLLFGKDSLNSAAFEIKPLDPAGNPAHNLEHSVQAELLADGRPVVLRKVFAEKYTKRRGSAKADFTGHTTEYFFDGVPLKEKEYQERIKGLVDERVFRLITDPRYFNEQLHWAERRKILMEICGDVSVQDVIASDKSLAGLVEILNGHGIEDAKKIIAGKRKDINEQLEKIPVRIDETKRGMQEIRSDIGTVPGQINRLEMRKQDLEAELADAKNGGAISKKRVELQEVGAEIQRIKNAWEDDKRTLAAPFNAEIEALHEKMREYNKKVSGLDNDLDIYHANLASYLKEIEKLREEWHKTDSQVPAVTDHCPTCGQALPEIQVQEAAEKLNKAKAEKLSGIDARGKELKAKVEQYTALIAEAEKMKAGLQAEWKALEDQEDALKPKLEAIRSQLPDVSALEARKTSIQVEIDNIQASEQGLVNEVQSKLSQVKAEIQALQADLAKVDQNTAAEQRIADLEKQEKTLAGEFEKIESDLFLVENFIRAKVGMLEDRINGAFGLVRFKLFSDQINGGLTEVCETTLNGVPYGSVNNAGRIQAGLDIIGTLQAYYGVMAPVFIDNRESVVHLPEMKCQTISLIVSEQDKVLRIENSDKKQNEKEAA